MEITRTSKFALIPTEEAIKIARIAHERGQKVKLHSICLVTMDGRTIQAPIASLISLADSKTIQLNARFGGRKDDLAVTRIVVALDGGVEFAIASGSPVLAQPAGIALELSTTLDVSTFPAGVISEMIPG